MVEWKPIARDALAERIAQGAARMSRPQRALWDAIRIEPEKWLLHPYGDTGGGFWVVAIVGRSVIWYNDLDEGFNRSGYTTYGEIDDYWRNDDELDIAVGYLATSIEKGVDLLQLRKAPKKTVP